MRNTGLFVAFSFSCLLLTIKANAQFSKSDSCGVYPTFQDYLKQHFDLPVSVHRNGYTIWPQGFLINKDIELKTPDTTIVYKRSDIWGYTDHKGHLIRIFNSHHYRVMCEKGLVVYIIYSPTRTSYHFSRELNAPIFRLTRKNLYNQFADKPQLIQKIKATQRKYWFIWDENNEQYLLNKLFVEMN